MRMSAVADIDAYIKPFPPAIKTLLKTMRHTIQEAAPEATEAIRYGMPTFQLNGNLVHFAAFTHHIGFYPTPSGIMAFQKPLSKYKGAMGSVQFPLDEPLPLALITQMVKFRVKQMKEKRN